jgi:hypothetical protein
MNMMMNKSTKNWKRPGLQEDSNTHGLPLKKIMNSIMSKLKIGSHGRIVPSNNLLKVDLRTIMNSVEYITYN